MIHLDIDLIWWAKTLGLAILFAGFGGFIALWLVFKDFRLF